MRMLKWGRHVSAISKVNEKAVTYLYQRWDCIDPIFADVMPKQQPAPTTRSSKRATHIHSGEQTETKKKKRTSTASGSETTEKSRRKYDPESSSSSYDESKWQSPTKKLPQHVEIGYPEKAGSGEYAPKWSREYPHPLWEKHYENIIKMRESKTAPVDTMGCERLADEESSPKVRRYQTLISLMLSSQTKDQITSEAVYRLRKHGLWPSNIAKTSESEISNIIYPVGFYKRKAQYIKRATDILMEKYDDDIPDSIKGLTDLPGVGPKMAYICMNVAWDKAVGIGVDVHVHRIANRLHWVKTKTPEETREALENFLPVERWSSVNALLVGFGQEICLPTNPKCDSCLNQDVCPTGRSSRKQK